MATGNFGIERRQSAARSDGTSRQDRIVLVFFTVLAAYSALYLLALSHLLQV